MPVARYMVFKNSTGFEFPVVFSELMGFEIMARQMKPMKPVSAGYVSFHPRANSDAVRIEVHESINALGLSTRGDLDREVLHRHIAPNR